MSNSALDLGETLDLGGLTGPVLVFGGPYSNLQATLAMKRVAQSRGILANRVICTGDVVAYCAQPEETVATIRAWGIHVVQGNCEQSIGESLDDCGCGFEEGSACSILSDSWYQFTQANVSDDSRQWMASLPTELRFSFLGRQFCCIHGDASKNNHFVFESTSLKAKAEQCTDLNTDTVIGGHCGLPFGQFLDDEVDFEGESAHEGAAVRKVWLNPGVIGMPANDGTATVWYLVLTPSKSGIEVSWHRLDYDYETTQSQMQGADLPSAYTDALANGLWPSEDVLPQAERSQRGEPISLAPIII